MTEIALHFDDVAKNYGRSTVLRKVSFDVPRGAFFGLVGANGAGKTTLLKCLLDFCEFESGGIAIFGTPHDQTAARRQLAFLPEKFTPPYYLTGRDFISYVLEMQSMEYRREEAEQMMRALDLDLAALRLPVRAYSKGMTQKLGLVACFLSRKELYILDEPTSGLDPKARALLKAYLRGLRAQSRTVFFTSHSLADVAEVCDRMAVLHDGSLRFAGSPQGLREKYAAPDLEQAYLRCIADDHAAPS